MVRNLLLNLETEKYVVGEHTKMSTKSHTDCLFERYKLDFVNARKMIEDSHAKVLATADILYAVASRTGNDTTANRLRQKAAAMTEQVRAQGAMLCTSADTASGTRIFKDRETAL